MLTIISLSAIADGIERIHRRIPINYHDSPNILIIHPLHRPLARIYTGRISDLPICILQG